MDRRAFLALLPAAPLALAACTRDSSATAAPGADPVTPLRLSKAEWRRLLPPDAYAVLFEEATEPPFSSPLNRERRRGTYVCAACSLPLFTSDAKYDSGTGWPSFTRPIPGRLNTQPDHALAEARTEYHCARCGGHQGHVFDDGPRPARQRWCNNGLALRFVPAGEPLPPLRTR
jgi:peptide-methionine (R)-S-oxide reductase